jgi:cytochrome d ubiquinol oxidase subunit II
MPHDADIWTNLAAAAALGGIMAYALLGGADFGGGIWNLLASGPRKAQQREAIERAMGPVWEANHVWLIFVLVVLFTCFPRGYAPLGIAFFLPFHLALLGIMLRGAAFIFRAYHSQYADSTAHVSVWGAIFGIASTISPILLGAAFGAITQGAIVLTPVGDVQLTHPYPWLTPYALGNGLLALSTCAYLAAVYLTNQTSGALQEDFRRRAILAGTSTAALAVLVIVLAWFQADWFLSRLVSFRTAPVILAGLVCFAGSAWATWTRRYRLSRLFAAGEIVLLIAGWGLAQYPYLVYPSITFAGAAAPTPTLKFVVATLPFGALLLIPSLWLLFSIFSKSVQPADSTADKKR